jgi:hypothetical protein
MQTRKEANKETNKQVAKVWGAGARWQKAKLLGGPEVQVRLGQDGSRRAKGKDRWHWAFGLERNFKNKQKTIQNLFVKKKLKKKLKSF